MKRLKKLFKRKQKAIRPNNFFQEYRDYEIIKSSIPNERDNIKLLAPTYVGVIVTIGTVKFSPPGRGKIVIKFDYNILDDSGFGKETLENDPNFIETLGDVIVSIVNSNQESLSPEDTTEYRETN